MAITVEIAGVARSTKIRKDISWTDSVNGQAQATFTLADKADGFVPADGQAVEIKQDGTVRFDGQITGRPRSLGGPAHSKQLTFYEVTVGSYELLLNKKTVTREYEAVAFETIVADLDATYLSADGITLNVTAGTSHTITFNGETIAECLDILCELEADGRTWRMDIGKILTIETILTTPAPAILDVASGTLELNPKPSVTPDRNAYANTVIMTGGGPDFPITYTAFDSVEIAARVVIEGGDGIYEYTEERPELKTQGEVQAAAEGKLAQKVTLRERFVGTTRVAGFAAGQSVTVNIPSMDIAEQVFFVESVQTVSNAAGTLFVHTINGITGDPDGGWQSYYRREKKKPRTIPMQIEAAPGLVRVESEGGPLVHDPDRDPMEFFQADASGALDEGPSGIGIMHRRISGSGSGNFMITVRRGGGSGTDGCGGGFFPGYLGGAPACFPSRQTIVEKWAISSADKVGTSVAVGFSWDEFAANANFKTFIVIDPTSTYAAVIQYGAPGKLIVVSIAGGGIVGSVDANIVANTNLGEPVWTTDGYLYAPNITDGKIFIYDLRIPSSPIEVGSFVTSLSAIKGLVTSSDEAWLYGVGTGGFVSLDRANPEVLVEDTALAAGTYASCDINADDSLIAAAVRVNSSNVKVATVAVSGGTITTTFEGNLALSTGLMSGIGAILEDGALIVFNQADPSGIDTLKAHVFNLVDPTAPTFTETLSYTHGAAGNLGPAKTAYGRKVLYEFAGLDAQITFGVEAFDKIVPYTIGAPNAGPLATRSLPPRMGGSGLREGQRGNIEVWTGRQDIGLIDPPEADGQSLISDFSESALVKWGAELSRGYHFGSFKEQFNAVATSGGVTVIMSLEKTGGGDLTMLFSDGLSILDCTPALTIVLTAGSDTSPTENFVYILQSDKLLAVSTSDWPAGEHNKVAFLLVPSATKVQSDGCYINQNWNDFLSGITPQGHGLHIAEAIRHMGAQYNSGIDGNGTTGYLTITTVGGGPDTIHFKSTAGIVYQLHEHTFTAEDTSAGGRILVVNDSAAPFDEITDLADLLLDSGGGSMTGKYFNFVFWGVANKSGEFQPVMVNLPSGSYNKQSDAEQDVSAFDTFSIPAAFDRESSTGFLIARVTLRHQAAGGGTWTHIRTLDLRGVNPAGAVGGSTGLTTTEFADNAFKIFDEGDVTKMIVFQASGIASGNTRTVAAEDGPMTMPLTSEWDDLTDAGESALHTHDHGALNGKGDDDHTIYALLAGRSGGQTLIGDTASGGDLTLQSTAHATKGKILFGAAGNSAYNEVTDNLGLGTSSPAGKLHVVQESSQGILLFDTYRNGQAASSVIGRHSRGTIGAESAVNANDFLVSLAGRGWHSGGAFTGVDSASIVLRAAEGWTAIAQGSFQSFFTTPIGNTSAIERFRISSDGNVGIGSNPVMPSTGTLGLFFRDGVAPSSLATNTAGLYANDVSGTVEMFAIDEAGNSAQLTPHNFSLFEPDDADEYPWSYFARNDYLGVEIGINFARLVRLVEESTGEKLIHIKQIPARDWVDDQETHMHRRMVEYERWENAPKETDEGEAILAPQVPGVKDPPAWLQKRLRSKGLFEVSRATALQQELGKWITNRGL